MLSLFLYVKSIRSFNNVWIQNVLIILVNIFRQKAYSIMLPYRQPFLDDSARTQKHNAKRIINYRGMDIRESILLRHIGINHWRITRIKNWGGPTHLPSPSLGWSLKKVEGEPEPRGLNRSLGLCMHDKTYFFK